MEPIGKWIRKAFTYGPGRVESPDPTPVEVPITRDAAGGVNSLADLRRLMAILNDEARRSGRETFEEANDFELEEDFDDAMAPAQLKAQAVDMALDTEFEKRPPNPPEAPKAPEAPPAPPKPAEGS